MRRENKFNYFTDLSKADKWLTKLLLGLSTPASERLLTTTKLTDLIYQSLSFNILNDFVCSMCIRIARDMFALLPIKNVIVHADLFDNTVISVNFDRSTMSKIKFGYIDSSDTILKFKSNINFNEETGYMPVCRL